MQGRVSQIFNKCLRSNLIKCRKYLMTKLTKPFFVIKFELGLKLKFLDTLPCIVTCSIGSENVINLY